MIYRLLGGVSMFVGAVFGLITLAVLIPFLNTFSGSLLILVGVFGIVAWVFLAIGWQLLRPPKRKPAAEDMGSWQPDLDVAAGGVEDAAPGERSSAGGAERIAMSGDEGTSADQDPLEVVFESGFSTFDVVDHAADEVSPSEGEGAELSGVAARSIDERLAGTATTFKKPYQAPEQGDGAGG